MIGIIDCGIGNVKSLYYFYLENNIETKIIRSQSSLHLGHYQFGDQTASILSKSLSSNFDAQKNPLPRRLSRLDQPGKV